MAQPAVANNAWALACAALLASALGASAPAHAGEAEIRKAFAERFTEMAKVDEVSKTPIAGLYEVRIGADFYYVDETASYLIQRGELIDTKSRVNLTEARIQKFTAFDFASLPLKDAVVWKQGDGSRKVAVFADPNCGVCKMLEVELRKIENLTVYTFLIPILGGDSPQKVKNIWCVKDRSKTWNDWMINSVEPPRAMGSCDTAALVRNIEMAQAHKLTGTPAIVFEAGKHVPGFLKADDIEKRLAASKKTG
jgi:thiol:disulfide interchange protein DsbC